MSLLEDVFLEDEAGEAQELERIIEGDEYDVREREDQNSDGNSEKDDEAEEDKRRVDPSSTKTKHVVKNPRFVLNPARLTGPRGISVIPEHFKDFKFKGKGHEKEDLDLILKKLEHWAYRLYPKFKFEDCLKKIETLGKKRPVAVHLHKIRSDQFINEETVVQKDSSDEEELAAPLPPEEDEFDQLLQQQIDLARATPGPGENRPGFNTPAVDKRSPLLMPKATSSPSISDEQRERMIRNRKLAEERRLARLKATENGNTAPTVDLTNGNIDENESIMVTDETNLVTNGNNDEIKARKNRSNVIDSFDDDEDDKTLNRAVPVDVHTIVNEKVVDLTDIQRIDNTSNEIDLPKTGYQKKSYVIVSSDDDDDKSINQDNIINKLKSTNEKIVDLTELPGLKTATSNDTDLEITGVQHKKKDFLSSGDDEQMNEAVDVEALKTQNENTIDLTECYQGRTFRKSIIELDMEITETQDREKNTIDSSDDEDVSFVNEAIVVDVHNGNRHNNDEIAAKEVNDTRVESRITVIADGEENKVVDDGEKLDVVVDASHTATVNCDSAGNEDDVMITEKSSNLNQEMNSEVTEVIEISDGASNDCNKRGNKEIYFDAGKENIDNNSSKVVEELDDLMDVDFSEDF